MCEKNKEYSAFKQACIDSHKNELAEYQILKNVNYKYSKRYKRKMSRLGREKVGFEKPFYPEVDNAFERARSKLICWWNERKGRK